MPDAPPADLAGRTALVTGATSGLGEAVAELLLGRGATVLVGARSEARFLALRERLKARLGSASGERIEPAYADLASMASVAELARRLLARPPLDLVFLNAGIHDVAHRLTDEGHDLTYATNYLGHFLLLHRLLSAGHLAPTARVVVSQSEAVHGNPFARADLEGLLAPQATPLRRALWRATASPNSKVLLSLALRQAARGVAGTRFAGVRFVAASPGGLRTGNVDQPGLAMRLLKLLAPLVLRPASAGAELLVWAATAREAGEAGVVVFGRDRRPVRLTRRASDDEVGRRAWEETERLLGLPPLAVPSAR